MSPESFRPASSLVGVIEQDARGVITGWSTQAQAIFGWSFAEAEGMAASSLIPERNHDRHRRSLTAILEGPDGNPQTRVITMRSQDGREFPVEISISAVLRRSGKGLVAVARPVVEVREERRFEANPGRFRAILDQVEDPCTVMDLRGHYVFVNEAFCRTFGHRRQDILGTNFSVTASAMRAAQFRDIYSHVYRTGQPNKGFEYHASFPDGTTKFFEQSVSLERDASGTPVGFLAISRDCTARKMAERDTARAREAAETASRTKSEFLANMSHEIRTPMNGIIGMAELALDTDLTPFQQDCLLTVRASAESLLTILNSILDFSRIESRKLELESIPFSIHDCVAETLKPLAVQAERKGLELMADIAVNLPSRVIGDPARVRQVLTNLLGNAIKFTEQGHVLLSVGVDVERQGSVRLRFAVVDTGIGIPTEKHETIFEAFTQADGSTTRRFGGTGLGLAISAALVRQMGGQIGVESRVGEGSSFQFTLSLDAAADDAAVVASGLQRLAGLRVLIADDNPVNRRILETQVAGWRMDAVVVDGGRAALDRLLAASSEGHPFSLVLLDAQMPDVDGFAVAQEIVARPELAASTIMMLSSSGEYGDASRCRSLGIASYLTKPVRQADLQEAIARVLEGTATVRPAPPRIAPATGGRSLRVLLAEDNVVNERVAVGLLGKRGHHVTVAHTGREAVDAVHHGTFDLVLMDIQMPDLSGLEATAIIREREQTTGRHVRIVAMTAHAMVGDRERCLAAGMDGYLSKPIDPNMLFAVVEMPGSSQQEIPVTVPPEPIIDRQEALNRMGGDEQLFADVIRIFLEDCPVRVAAIKSGVDEHDAERIRSEAHALKGSAGNVSAKGLFDAARTMERIGAEGRLNAAEGAWRLLTMKATEAMDELRSIERRLAAAAD